MNYKFVHRSTVDPYDFVAMRDFNAEFVGATLSKLCRYTGRCKYFYSVAQHSQLVSCIAGRLMLDRFAMQATKLSEEVMTFDIVKPNTLQQKKWAVEFYRVRLMALLHDAFEFQIGDIASPLKNKEEFNNLRQIEHKAMQDIYKFHGIDPFLWELEIVKHADRYALSFEVMELMDWYHERWTSQLYNYPASKVDGFTIEKRTPELDEVAWIQDYHDLVDGLSKRREALIR